MDQESVVFYPELSEQGKLEAQEYIENFKSKLRKSCADILSEVYVDIPVHIETDAWFNYRNQIWRELTDYKNLKENSHNYKQLRQSIFEEHRDDLVKELNQDLLDEVESLKKQLQSEREFNRR